jgi:ferredoxin--NADP+ reductase
LLPNQAGRVTDDGIYAAGWIKRGPSGLIGNNKKCAAETVHTLLADVENLAPCPKPSAPVINKRVISFADWKVIDAHEEANGTPRKKVLTIEEALKVLD